MLYSSFELDVPAASKIRWVKCIWVMTIIVRDESIQGWQGMNGADQNLGKLMMVHALSFDTNLMQNI